MGWRSDIFFSYFGSIDMAAPQAMILAAGLGTRLKPYSLVRPKPLFPILDVPLLLRLIDQLRRAGFSRLTVNAHHLRQQIVDVLAGERAVRLQLEEQVLGTGGGLRLASSGFGAEPVLVTNGDIHHSIDLQWVYEQHCQSGAAVSLVLHDHPRFNQVLVDSAGRIRSFGRKGRAVKQDCRALAFTGIHVVHPDLLELMPPGVFYDIIDCYEQWLAKGGTVNAILVEGHQWTDMGTPDDYLALHRDLLLAGGQGDHFLGRAVRLDKGVCFDDWVVVGSGARICQGARLARVVVWDGAVVPSGSHLEDKIVT